MDTSLRDLQTPADIRRFVDAFYDVLLADAELAPIFIDVAAVDLDRHKPIICAYWEKLLLGGGGYQRHTMNIHRVVHEKRALRADDFDRWLGYFTRVMDATFSGQNAERAKALAATIATNMQKSLR